jgi:tetrahydromethanopterin S-methyltransferase subunit H
LLSTSQQQSDETKNPTVLKSRSTRYALFLRGFGTTVEAVSEAVDFVAAVFRFGLAINSAGSNRLADFQSRSKS